MNTSELLKDIEGNIASLTDSILDEKFLDKDNLRVKIETFMISGLFTILSKSISDLDRAALNLKSELARGAYDYNPQMRHKKMYELSEINDKIKFINRSVHAVKDFNEYDQMKRWVGKKFGDKALIEFYQMQPQMRVELMKNDIKQTAKQLIPKKNRLDEIIYKTK